VLLVSVHSSFYIATIRLQALRQDLAAWEDKSQKEGPKTRRGGTFLKYCIGCMQQPGGANVKWGARISNGEGGHHWPPLLATALYVFNKLCAKCQVVLTLGQIKLTFGN